MPCLESSTSCEMSNESHTSVLGFFLSGINISFSFHISYLTFYLNHTTKAALQEIQSLGMALL